MRKMDDVFGNSSNETVVSVNEEIDKNHMKENFDLSFDASQDSEVFYDCDSNCGFLCNNEIYGQNSLINRESVIKHVKSGVENKIYESVATSKIIFKSPLPVTSTSSRLSQSQSAIVTRPLTLLNNCRPRAHSTTTASLDNYVESNSHTYQNIPANSFIYPCYVNVPQKGQITATEPKNKNFKSKSVTSSPNGSHKIVTSKLNSSYIQLWTGSRQKRNLSETESDDEDDCSSLSSKPSSRGYVKMSSPYIRSPNTSILSDFASRFAASTNTSGVTDYFCPFCPRLFISQLNLSHHIEAIHSQEMASIVLQKDLISVQFCPLCQTIFFNKDILPNHLLEFHRNSFITLLDKHQCLEITEDLIVKCPFCTKQFNLAELSADVLLFHILQFHNHDYKQLVNTLFPFETTKSLGNIISCNSQTSSTPGLSLKFKSLSCHLESKEQNTFKTKAEEQTKEVNPVVEQETSQNMLATQEKGQVRRELRFTIPPVTSEITIPDSPENSTDLKDTADDESDSTAIIEFNGRSGKIPVRVDSLASADFIELTQNRQFRCCKKRRLSLPMKSKRKKKENLHTFDEVFDGLKNVKKLPSERKVVTTASTRTFKKPLAIVSSRVSSSSLRNKKSRSKFGVQTVAKTYVKSRSPRGSGVSATTRNKINEILKASDDPSPFSNMKLYAPLRMFRCNGCRLKFSDSESLNTHIKCKHKGFLGFVLPHFGCAICSGKFYENKFLVKHCLQHHTSLLEIRSPEKQQFSI